MAVKRPAMIDATTSVIQQSELPTHASYTPTLTLVGGTGNTVPTYTTNYGRTQRVGGIRHCKVLFAGNGGVAGAGTGRYNISLPEAASASQNGANTIFGRAINGATEYMLVGVISASATTMSLDYWNALTTTTGFTGALQNNATRVISIEFSYFV